MGEKMGMFAFHHSALNTPKDSNCTLSTLDFMYQTVHTGRGQFHTSFDGCNTNMNVTAVYYNHYHSSPFSPRRYWDTNSMGPYPLGRSFMPNDYLTKEIDSVLSINRNGFGNIAEKVDFLRENCTACENILFPVDRYYDWNKMFQKLVDQGVYLPPKKWKAGKHKILIRDGKPVSLEFQSHREAIFNKWKKKYELWGVPHPHHVAFRVTDDYCVKPLLFPIVAPKWRGKPLPPLEFIRAETPSQVREVLKSTRTLVYNNLKAPMERKKFLCEEYYVSDKIVDQESSKPEIDYDVQTYAGLVRKQLEQIEFAKGNQKFLTGGRKELQKCPCLGKLCKAISPSGILISNSKKFKEMKFNQKQLRVMAGMHNLPKKRQ